MRTLGGLHKQMLERENLLLAVHLAAKGRRAQPAVRRFLENQDDELARMREELRTASPECGQCVTFTIHDPKKREITAPVFRERVLHHAVMNVCAPVLERRQIHHSYACRAGKGMHAALGAARQNAAAAPWFLKLDVRAYFASIPHDRLMAALGRVFREKAVLRLLEALVKAYTPGAERGLPIGTLVSQHLANFYLSSLDTLVVQELRPVGYVRYMDDLVLWLPEAAAARQAAAELKRHAEAVLGLQFKPASIHRTARGMDFLGHRVFPHRLGLNRASRRRFQQKITALSQSWAAGKCTESTAQARADALLAATAHAGCRTWRKRVILNLGGRPQGVTACCAAGAGSTTGRTSVPASATATRPTTATGTSASVPPPAPATRQCALMEPARLPARVFITPDETQRSRRRPVAPVDAARQRGRREHSSSGRAFQALSKRLETAATSPLS